MVVSKYDGVILDGRWKYDHTKKCRCVFKNIYNGEETLLSYKQVNDVRSGKTSVSRIISRRIKGEGIFRSTFSLGDKRRKYHFAAKKRREK